MSVLCATDFSEESLGTLGLACALAHPGEDVWIVHALDVLDPSLARMELGDSQARAERLLADAARRFEQACGRPAKTMLLHGNAPEAIVEFAEIQSASLIVVASRGHKDTPLRKIGGTSERIAQTSHVPLLVVRDPAPFDAWIHGQRPLRVMLGVDETSSWETAFDWVARMRAVAACDVVVGQIYYDVDARKRYGLKPFGGLTDPDPEVEELIERDMRARIGALPGYGAVTFRPVRGVGRLGDHLLQLAREERVDLIALGTHRRWGLARLASVPNVTLHYGHAAVLLAPRAEGRLHHVAAPRRVLVATDLSPFSNAAISHACALVEGREGEVVVLHVSPDSSPDPRDLAAATDELRTLVANGGAANARVEVTKSDHPAKAICEAAERMSADIVCIASHGRTGLSRALLGSISEDVIRHSHRPVLVVRSPSP